VTVTREDLARVLAGAAFQAGYGFRVSACGDGVCTVEVPFRPVFERPGGVVSGPVFMAAADAAMWMAVLTRLGVDDTSVTVELRTAFLSAARQEDFTCTARVLKWGRRLIYGVAECAAGDGRLLAHHTIWYARTGIPGASATEPAS
jgi:uncharacterized protein (TIGR00369 family)